MGGYGVMPDLFQAQLRAIDARNRAVSSIGQSRAGIQYGKEREQQEEARRQIAKKQQDEALRTQKVGREVQQLGTTGATIGGYGTKFAIKAALKKLATGGLKTALGSSLGTIILPAAGAYLLSKALTKKKTKKFKGKEINEADIANIETEYFRRPQSKQIRHDLGQINTSIRSAKDILKASREDIAQKFAESFALQGVQEQALSTLFGAGKDATKTGQIAAGTYGDRIGAVPSLQTFLGNTSTDMASNLARANPLESPYRQFDLYKALYNPGDSSNFLKNLNLNIVNPLQQVSQIRE